MNKYNSIILLILRLLYIEKRKELATYSEEVTVLMEEIREKFAMLKIKSKPNLDKSMEKDFVKEFKKYNIIQNLDTDVNQADTRIVIYPSIILAVAVENVNDYYEMTMQKLKEYAENKDIVSDNDEQ